MDQATHRGRQALGCSEISSRGETVRKEWCQVDMGSKMALKAHPGLDVKHRNMRRAVGMKSLIVDASSPARDCEGN